MNAVGILLVLLGVWVFINAVNGNLPGLFNGQTQFNTGLFTGGASLANTTPNQQPTAPPSNFSGSGPSLTPRPTSVGNQNLD